MNRRPLLAHVLYRLDTGGMERIVVSLLNATQDRYRHAVICLAGFGGMRDEIQDHSVQCLSLDKRPGKDWRCYSRFRRTLAALQPDLVQTYNLGTLDLAPLVKLAGVRRLVHAEHGRDASDPRGEKIRYQLLRRWMAPFITRYVAVSPELAHWLSGRVGIKPRKITCIPNGIDTAAFRAMSRGARARRKLRGFAPPHALLIGNVARLDKVKDHAGLLRGFAILREQLRDGSTDCRLVIIGDGPEREPLQRLVWQLGLAGRVCMPGSRTDVAELLAECDVFALSSIAEGIPLTILEAMAAGLPVVSTDVGGIRAVVDDGVTGTLVAPSDPELLAEALAMYVQDPALRRRHGDAGRVRVAARFSLPTMVSAYTALYDQLLQECAPARRASHLATAAEATRFARHSGDRS